MSNRSAIWRRYMCTKANIELEFKNKQKRINLSVLIVIDSFTRVGSSGFWHKSTTTPGCVLLPLLYIKHLKWKLTYARHIHANSIIPHNFIWWKCKCIQIDHINISTIGTNKEPFGIKSKRKETSSYSRQEK
jgi:hypothetical protein